MSVTLILGGARSGKSRFAESVAKGEKHYVATAEPHDDEMRARILMHQQQRGAGWTTHEAPLKLAETLAAIDGAGRFILVDCLTLWLNNLMMAQHDIDAAASALVAQLAKMKADVVLVSNEVGLGLVPETKLGRDFRDAQGRLNSQVAAAADHVVFVAAGLPLVLKGQISKQL